MTDPDLPSTIDDLTAEMARNAPAGPEADRLCLQGMGCEIREHSEDFATHYLADEGGSTYAIRWKGDGWGELPHRYRASRTPEGAYRAREWLRKVIDPSQFGDDAVEYTDVEVSVSRYNAVLYAQAFGEHCNFHEIESLYPDHSGNEALNTARLLLLLHAEGVLS